MEERRKEEVKDTEKEKEFRRKATMEDRERE